jgi:hypothetical protein
MMTKASRSMITPLLAKQHEYVQFLSQKVITSIHISLIKSI